MFLLRLCILTVILFTIQWSEVKAQGEANNWYFGYGAGISFNSGMPYATNNSAMITYEGCASISDQNGRLLFYTNGVAVWNRNNIGMSNGYGLKGHESSTQSCIIVPKPGSSSNYYIFTTSALEKGPVNQMYYSEVDMRLQQGTGDVTAKNIPLLGKATEKLAATFHRNTKDVWVITHEWDTNQFYAYLVTEKGIQAPVISNSGQIHTGGLADPYNNVNALGALKISPDGSKLAAVIHYDGIVELFNFDNATGKVYNPISLPVNRPYGAEFSPDGTKLYVSTLNGILFQYPLSGCSAEDIAAGEQIRIARVADDYLGSLQLASNGKIYVAHNRSRYLGIINNPNETGTACNFVEEGFYLDGKISALGLPNFIGNYFDRPPYSYISNCVGQPTSFSVNARANIDSVRWEFAGDTRGLLASSGSFTTQYTFEAEGTYQVKLSIYYKNKSLQTFCRYIRIAPDFEFSLGKDTVICNRAPFYLSVFGVGESNVWQNGSAGETHKITQSGTYWVDVKKGGCIKRDSITVLFEECPVTIPNVITPNQDGFNDTFFIPDLQENWSLSITNRWGKIIYETKNYRNDWSAQGVEAGLYFYFVHDPSTNRTFKGWVQVFR
jgi:gliding motility-associated-like protein